MTQLLLSLTLSFFLCLQFGRGAVSEEFQSPDILVLGDSQLTFGAGPAFLEFFQDIKAHCSPDTDQKRDLEKLGHMSVGVIGVRSTSLPSWTARKGRQKGLVCDIDPKWKVNAGTYGAINQSSNPYVQIGSGKTYNFCKKGKSPFEAMFEDKYYMPKLFIMFFLGNSARRWANSKDAAFSDVKETMRQLPPGMPCIFMTTAPAYRKKTVDLRLAAQKNVQQAFEETGMRCDFVPGLTPETVAANLGNKHYFRLNKAGKVKDPYHPNRKAAKNFFAVEMDDICKAIFHQVEDKQTSRLVLRPALQ